MPTGSSATVFLKAAAPALLAALLCAGCMGPLSGKQVGDSCGCPVGECDECSPNDCSEGCDCLPTSGGFYGICTSYCCSAWYSVADTCEPVVCWPKKKICHVVNFCAPDGWCGPPPLPGPGRFHPVPTHNVFAPAPETMIYPAE